MKKKWKVGDAVVVLNDERNRAMLQGEICDITTEDRVPFYHVRANGNTYGSFHECDLITPKEYEAIRKESWTMGKITLIRCDDGAIWVTSDREPIGTEATFETITDEKEQFLIALASHLGYEPAELFNF